MSGIPAIRRLWGVIRDAGSGRNVLAITAREPDPANMRGALLLTGMLADDGRELTLDIVSDPTKDPALKGPQGSNGWTPLMVGEADGTRTLVRVADWTGGKGDKPAVGYLGGTGSTGLVAKAAAFNFNAIKRVDIFSGVSNAQGIAAIAFAPAFATTPAKALPIGVPNVLAGPVTAAIVAGSVTKDGCQVKVTSTSLVGGAVAALVGATVSVIVIEA